ncbi:SLC13 family permease [Bacillus sp. J33]|uniref:SLC13 family permease n=1 Tax=Bacillus sp. J33 TaxID=935836 RepID=UPI00047ACE88|nr:SLC13 family permease [Bacillus sp. J33]
MSMQAISLCIVLMVMFTFLIKEWFPAEITVFLAMSTLILTGILSVEEALSGFANPGVHTVAHLFILGAAVAKSGILHEIVEKLLDGSRSLSKTLFRIMLPTSVLSAFINNTPLVTILLPSLQKWAISNNIKPSKVLIPLSFAAILGGTITLIGTSTNLIVQGLIFEKGLEGFRLFDFAYFGIPIAFIGIIYLALASPRILPDRQHNIQLFQQERHLYIHCYEVKKKSPLIGKTVTEAMLRNLKQLYLIEIKRGQAVISPVSKEEILQSGDILVFSGNPDGVINEKHYLGFKNCTEETLSKLDRPGSELFEVGIPLASPLINMKIKDIHFRSKYHAVIVAIKRKGQLISSGFGNIRVLEGDTLVLLAKTGFEKTWGDSGDFYFITPSASSEKRSRREKSFMLFILLGIIVLSIFQAIPIFKLTLMASIFLIITGTINITDAIKSINWRIIILMGSSLGIGKAVGATGLASNISSLLIGFQNSLGIIGILILFYLITMVLTEILNNLATAALMFPIGFAISEALKLEPLMFAMLTAIAASCSFLTPIGYQTNMLVYGPGGYKFKDYFKAGLPLSLICMSTAIFMAWLKWL